MGAEKDSRHPPSTSTTLFDESIIQPIKARQKQKSSYDSEHRSHSNGSDSQRGKSLSMFEKMMMSLKGRGHLTSQGVASEQAPTNNKDKDKPKNSNTHHAEWKHFITGTKEHEVSHSIMYLACRANDCVT